MFFDLQKLFNTFPSQPRSVKTFFGISLDFACSIFSVWVAYYLRLGDFVSLSERGLSALILSILISYPIFYFFGLYKTIFRYSGINSLLTVSRVVFYSIFYTLLISFIGIRGIPRTLGIINLIVSFNMHMETAHKIYFKKIK